LQNEPRGFPALRAAVARYLAQFRGVRCGADQIVVFNSAQQALVCLAVLLVNRGDAVWIEDPCYLERAPPSASPARRCCRLRSTGKGCASMRSPAAPDARGSAT